MDKKAFEHFFKMFFSPLLYFALKYVPDEAVAKDIVHDVFIRLWEKRETIDMQKPVKSYLFTAVHHRCLNYIRDHKKFSGTDTLTLESEEITNQEDIEQSELQQKIRECIDALPPKCREIFILSRFEELKYQEIADKQGISVKTVEVQVSKALKILRTNLADYITVVIYGFIKFF